MKFSIAFLGVLLSFSHITQEDEQTPKDKLTLKAATLSTLLVQDPFDHLKKFQDKLTLKATTLSTLLVQDVQEYSDRYNNQNNIDRVKKLLKSEKTREKGERELLKLLARVKPLLEEAFKNSSKEEEQALSNITTSINKLRVKRLSKDLSSDKEKVKEEAKKELLGMGGDAIKELEKDSSEEAKNILKELNDTIELIKKLIEQLADEDNSTRKKAEKELKKFGQGALPYLKNVTKGKEAERILTADKIAREIENKNANKSAILSGTQEIPAFKFIDPTMPVPQEDEDSLQDDDEEQKKKDEFYRAFGFYTFPAYKRQESDDLENIEKKLKDEKKRDQGYRDLLDYLKKLQKLLDLAKKDGVKDEIDLLEGMVNSINSLRIKQLIKDLGSEDKKIQEAAKEQLLELGDQAIKELEKEKSDQAKNALKELEKIREALKKFIEKLGSDDPEERDKAQKEITKYGKGAIPFVKEATKDKDPERSTRAQSIIDEIEKKEAKKNPKKKTNPTIRRDFSFDIPLWEFKEKKQEDEDGQDEKQEEKLKKLVTRLLILKDGGIELDTPKHKQEEDDIEKIEKSLKDEKTRDDGYRDLMNHLKRVQKLLEQAKKDGSKEEIELFELMINSINSLRIKRLVKDLASEDNKVQDAAKEQLLEMGEQAIKELKNEKSDEAKNALKELEKTKEKLKDLIEKLGNDDPEEREKAQKEIMRYGKGAIPFLKEATKDKDPERSSRAQSIIDEIEKKEAKKTKKNKTITGKNRKFLFDKGILRIEQEK